MNDFDSLTDAFSELERRADVVTANHVVDPVTSRRSRQAPRLVLVAAAVVAVLAVSLGIALFTRRQHVADRREPAASAPTATSASLSSTSPGRVAEKTRPTTPVSSSVNPKPLPPVPASIPSTAHALAGRFRNVLGGMATFTITLSQDNRSSIDPFVLGVLTASGRRGGFDLQMLPTTPGARAMCDSAPNGSTGTCTKRRLDDGSSLAVGGVTLAGASGGVTYQADLITKNGVEILVHVSNERDPKGESTVMSVKPPLSKKQLETIITSPRWFG